MSLGTNVFPHYKTIWRAVWLTDSCDVELEGDIPMHVHQTSNTPDLPINASPTAPNTNDPSLPLRLPTANDPITFTSEIAPDAPEDSVATSALPGANVTRRQTA